MFGEEAEADIPLVPFSAVSSIENGHKNLITSVQWVPDYFEVSNFTFVYYLINFICVNFAKHFSNGHFKL